MFASLQRRNPGLFFFVFRCFYYAAVDAVVVIVVAVFFFLLVLDLSRYGCFKCSIAAVPVALWIVKYSSN